MLCKIFSRDLDNNKKWLWIRNRCHRLRGEAKTISNSIFLHNKSVRVNFDGHLKVQKSRINILDVKACPPAFFSTQILQAAVIMPLPCIIANYSFLFSLANCQKQDDFFLILHACLDGTSDSVSVTVAITNVQLSCVRVTEHTLHNMRYICARAPDQNGIR